MDNMLKGHLADYASPSSLLAETIDALGLFGHKTEDVKWVGSNDGTYAISWDEFEKIANFGYDCGFGGQGVARDLVVVGNGWWLERAEYDGSEWWEHKVHPRLSKLPLPIKAVVHPDGSSWVTVAEIQKDIGDRDG